MPTKTAPATSAASKRFELLTLGNELLLGRTPNGHLTFIGEQLARRGVELSLNVVIPDDAETVANLFARSLARSDVVITTGGLGPTSDDLTREAIAEVLGRKLVFDKKIEKAIAARFAKLGRKMTANNLKQAWRPAGSVVLQNPFGTAPGLWIEKDGKVIVMMPGPPHELEPMWRHQVLPRLIRGKFVGRTEPYVQLRTVGVGESALEHRLQPLLAKHPDVEVAYCAHPWSVDLRLGWAKNPAVEKQARKLAEECRALLGEDVFAVGEASLAEVVGELLRDEAKVLAVAESGSGGQMANLFTDLPGASKYFHGGVVCYRNGGKVIMLHIPECLFSQHGAISPEVAEAMATGAAENFVADYALSLTCSAGHGASRAAGTAYVGLHTPEGVWAKRLDYDGSLAAVRARAINVALDWLRRELLRAQRAKQLPAAAKSATRKKPAAKRR